MSVTTLRPDGDVGGTATKSPGPGTTFAAYLSDNDDGTQVVHNDAYSQVTLDNSFSLPASALETRMVVRLRTGNGTSASTADIELSKSDGTVIAHGSGIFDWVALQTVTVLMTQDVVGLSEADVDGARLKITGTGGNAVRVYEAYVDVYYVTKPTLTVNSPSGTITTNVPTIGWTASLDSEGGAQTKVQVKVFSAAQYGAGGFSAGTSTPTIDSGELSGADGAATSYQVQERLPEATYKAYVRVAQTINGVDFWSNWTAGSAFTVDSLNPGVPTVSPAADATHARIRVTVDDTAGEIASTHFQVQHSLDAGVTWEDVRTALGSGLVATSGPAVVVDDYEIPNAATVVYRARAYNDAQITYSNWSAASSSIDWESTASWIKASSRPDLNLIVMLKSQPAHAVPARQATHEPLGRMDPVVIADSARGAKRGEITFIVPDEDDIAQFDELLDLQEPLLIQTPATDKWPDRWVRLGDLEATRFLDRSWGIEGLRAHSWIEVSAP